eukprot:2571171-Pleurochrysis_carterae.AAC.1
MFAVVEAPHARRAVKRPSDYVLAVGTHAHRLHVVAVPLERAQLRTFGEGQQADLAQVNKHIWPPGQFGGKQRYRYLTRTRAER